MTSKKLQDHKRQAVKRKSRHRLLHARSEDHRQRQREGRVVEFKTGVISVFYENKNFGFITPDDKTGDMYFKGFEISDLDPKPKVGDSVSFQVKLHRQTGKQRAISIQHAVQAEDKDSHLAAFKWYDKQRGFGFVRIMEGELEDEEVFVGRDVFDDSGMSHDKVENMCAYVCLGPGRKGNRFQVTKVTRI